MVLSIASIHVHITRQVWSAQLIKLYVYSHYVFKNALQETAYRIIQFRNDSYRDKYIPAEIVNVAVSRRWLLSNERRTRCLGNGAGRPRGTFGSAVVDVTYIVHGVFS